MPLELRALPARQGDALWIRWGDALEHQLLIDMGTEEIGNALKARFAALPADRRHFELVVVTHVDRDHIGGVLTGLAESDPAPDVTIGDVWFNGWVHLDGGVVATEAARLESMGPAQGERLSRWLEANAWNRTFGGAAVTREPERPLKSVALVDGLTLTVIGPTPARLRSFKPTWKEEVEEALRKENLAPDGVSEGLEAMGSSTPPVLDSAADLVALAESENRTDRSKANGSSIALVLKYGDARLLLAGDAFADDLVDGLAAYRADAAREGERVRLDLFKLPHHGSAKNLTRDLVRAVDCPRWLISSDGTQFKHPDAIAVARILRDADRPELVFNVPSRFNGWWEDAAWQDRFGYSVRYGTAEDGVTLTFA
ncbi:MAG: hypothetical protein ACF8XB_11390 [Planctomycetota bacterium JB042]